MSDLAHLHKRLSSAYAAPRASQDDETREDSSFADFDAYYALEPDPEPKGKAGPDEEQDGIFRLWLGGGGLLLSSLVLALGYETGFYVVSGGLAAVFFGSALIYVMEKRRSKGTAPQAVPAPRAAEAPLAPPVLETIEDRRWHEDENATLLATIHDALGDIAISRTMDRRIVHANTTFRDLTGCKAPEGRTCEEIGLAFRPGIEPHRFDVEIATPYGQRIFAWHDIITRDPLTGRLMTQSIARDITDERRVSSEREEARLKAENNSAAKSRLLATVSHEIRTPLSGILGMSHLLGQTRLTSEQKNYLNGIRQSGNALVQLVEDLLDFSTIEVGRFQLKPRAESLRLLIESVVEMLAHRAHEKGIEIASTVSSEIPELMNFDPARLRQVLFNVIGNAVKFTHTGGVMIAADLKGEDLVISVTDTGTGMTATEQARIFGEFEQAGSASDRNGGTGLGLSISARILQEFGGALAVASEKGKGSAFTIRFPGNIPVEHRSKNARKGVLAGTSVLLMAPVGPAGAAIIRTIETLGGACTLATDHDMVVERLDEARREARSYTDIIVDHRMAAEFSGDIAERPDVSGPRLRKIFLVNPEERNSQPQGVFDAWLIRPLREQSMIDVLRGRMRGMEKRDALNDNQPGFGLSVAEILPMAATGLNVVLAEDDPVNAMLVRAMLEKAGHSVRVVGDFETLLDIIWSDSGNRPDLIVTDLNMPGGEGLDVLARIRAHERRQGLPAVPVIVLSADDRDDSRRRALLNGANRVFSKPVDPERLIGEIQALSPVQAGWPQAR